MKTGRINKTLLISLIVLMAVIFTAGCGKKAEISITDEGAVTVLEVKLPQTVDKILEEADISLNDGDQVDPALGTKITDQTEIKVLRKHSVEINLGGEKKNVEIVGGTVEELLNREGIKLSEKQKINHELNSPITKNMVINIFEMASVTLKYDGKTETKEVEATTVEDAIKDAGVTLGKDDRVKPELTSSVTDGMEIVIDRVTTETITEKEEIDFEVEYIYDDSIYKGYQEVREEGVKGEKEVTYTVTKVNGEEESKKSTEEKIIKEPKTEVIALGTYEAEMDTSSSAGSEESSGRTVVSKTAFYDCDGSGHGYYEIVYSDGTTEYEQF